MKKRLAILLESLKGFESPKIELEQYVTPPALAAEMVVNAKLMNDLDVVVDLGCGTGILAIAASLLDARAIGFDVDVEALKIARKNAAKLGARVDFVTCKVEDVTIKQRVTTIMNPPFGIQKRHADKPFLEKAMEISNVIYTVHSAESKGFIERICDTHGFEVTHSWHYAIPLKKSYTFHEKEFKYIPVEVYRLRRCK
jgi:putative methylase